VVERGAGEVRETSGGEMVRRPEKVVVVERSGQEIDVYEKEKIIGQA